MLLLTETKVNTVKLITESRGGKDTYYLEGIFLQGNIKNKNGRIYPEEILDEAVGKYSAEYVKNNRAYGELNHPDSPNINLERAAILIKDLRKEGSNYVGKARVLSTPCGTIVKGLMEDGCNIGISSRGLGSLKEDKGSGANIVQDDFSLVTAGDIVADPSAPDAFLDSIMEESEWVFSGGAWVPRFVDETKKRVRKAPSNQLEELALKSFEKFLKNL